jgi:hypothetical protein
MNNRDNIKSFTLGNPVALSLIDNEAGILTANLLINQPTPGYSGKTFPRTTNLMNIF